MSTNPRTAAIELVMLDCDGVLFDSFDANAAFYDAVLAQIGLPVLDARGRELAHRLSTSQILEHFLPGDAAAVARGLEIARDLDYTPFLERMVPVPDLLETLAWLRARYRTAMVTNRSSTIALVVERFGLTPFLDGAYGLRDVARPKPAPDMLVHCLERLACTAASAVYVGDSPTDAVAARAAGVPFVAVGDAVSGDWAIEHVGELPALLARLSG